MRPLDGSRRMAAMSVVVFPQPDSPTRPSVCPGITSKETSSKARATSSRPPRCGKMNSVVRCCTLSNDSLIFCLDVLDSDHVLAAFEVMAGQSRVEHFLQHVPQQHAAQRDPDYCQTGRQIEPPRPVGDRVAIERKVQDRSPRWLRRVAKAKER